MPNWKKVIVSGSDASLNSLYVTNAVTASVFSGSFTGSIFGTASYSISASQALTSSFITASNVFGPFGSNSVISSSFALTASYASFADNGGVTQILAGPNITISPLSGKGQVTISSTGTGSGNFNTATGSYGSFYDTTTQTNPVANAANSMSFNEIAITNGVSLSGSTSPFNTYIKTENAGVYNIQFSAQIDKTDGGEDNIDIWIRKNGIDLTDTATTITLPKNNNKVVAAWNWFVQSATNDYYQIIWSSADVDMRLLAEVSSSVHPGIPSVILTANRVDQFLSNTGSFNGDFNGSFTGSLFGTSSFAVQAATASYVLNAVSSSFATSASFASNATSASHAVNSDTAISSSYAATASYADNFTVAGTLTAQTLVVQTITSSVIYSSGSNVFGNDLSNTQKFTGSVQITGSLSVNGSSVILTNQTSSMSVLSASYASSSTSASYAVNADFLDGYDSAAFLFTSSYNNFTASYFIASASFDTRILNNSSSIGLLSSSFLAFSSSYNTGSFTGSFNGVFTGSLFGTSSFAITSSFVTASNVFGPFGSNSVISSSFAISASHAPNALTASFAISASQAISASFAVTASYATFALSASNAPGFTTNFSQSVAAATWSFNHNLNTRNPLVQVYSPTFAQIVPNEIVGIDAFTVEVRFDYAQAGYAVASNGGGLYVTGSTPRLVQTVAAVTWSFQHNLGTKYPGYEVYDSNDNVIVPAGIRSVDTNNAEIYFAFPTTGVAIANFSGISGSLDNAISASFATYAVTASYADTFIIDKTLTDYATVASSINGSNTVFTQATGSFTSAFFKYTVSNGVNARSGEVMSVWNGTSVQFTDTSTVDIGTTSVVTSSVVISGANVLFNVQTNTSGWRIKSMGTFI
jgi:hypothetical protein